MEKKSRKFLAIGGYHDKNFIDSETAYLWGYFAFNKAGDNLMKVDPKGKWSGYNHNHTRIYIHLSLIPHTEYD